MKVRRYPKRVMEPEIDRHGRVNDGGDTPNTPSHDSQEEHDGCERPSHSRRVNQCERSKNADHRRRNRQQVRRYLAELLDPHRLRKIHIQMVEVSEEDEKINATPRESNHAISLPGATRIHGHQLV